MKLQATGKWQQKKQCIFPGEWIIYWTVLLVYKKCITCRISQGVNISPNFQEGACCHTDTFHCQWMGETLISVQIHPELLKHALNSLRLGTEFTKPLTCSHLGCISEAAVCYFAVYAGFMCGSSCWLKWGYTSSGVYICNGRDREKTWLFLAGWHSQSSHMCFAPGGLQHPRLSPSIHGLS